MNMETFGSRRFKYGTVEVRFDTKEEVASHATKSEKVNLLLTYKGKRSVRVKIGKELPVIELGVGGCGYTI